MANSAFSVSGFGSSGLSVLGQLTVSGGTPTLNYQTNITSITDNGVGDFSWNFTSALPSANYAFSCSEAQPGFVGIVQVIATPTSTVLRTLSTKYTTGMADDAPVVSILCGGG